jgi:DNA-binding response OmpR family regulator
MSLRILIVEDEPNLLLGIHEALAAEGWEPVDAPNPAEARRLLASQKPDLVLLDVMLPITNGFDLCREWRAANIRVPVIFLTAKSEEIDRVLGLEIGADDYLTKPFSLRELTARIRAVMRRTREPRATTAPVPETIAFGTVQIDTRALRGTRAGKTFPLTPRELAVMVALDHHRGAAVSRDDLLTQVWGDDYYGTTRTLDQVIVKLRRKIEAEPSSPRHLLTVHGHGYRLEP